ncbi:MAG TPA: GDSL-type esterase/lipase family protein, partial [Phycisphaeraceae bacterium]
MIGLLHPLRSGVTQHVVCYGTSLTACGAWVSQVAAALAMKYGNRVRVTNSGEGRQHSRWGLAHLRERALDLKPDVVLIEFAINDALTRFNLSPAESRANLTQMIDHI